MNDQEHKVLIMEWRKSVLRMDRMIASDAPNTIKAHFLVRILLPRLVRFVGISEYTEQLAAMQTEMLVGYLGLCVICKKESVDHSSVGMGYTCTECGRMCEQYAQNIDDDQVGDSFLGDN